MSERAIEQALRTLPPFRALRGAPARRRRLPGITNSTWRLDWAGRSYFLRIPGDGTDAIVDRRREGHNLRAALAAGLTPQVLWHDARTGHLVAPYREGWRTLSPALVGREPAQLDRMAGLLRRLHDSGIDFVGRFDPFEELERYRALARRRPIGLPAGTDGPIAVARRARRVMIRTQPALRPCHNDPVCENFLDDGRRLWLIDFEYAGFNDPLWDLADLAVEAGLGRDLRCRLLRAYFGRPPRPIELARFCVWMAVSDLLWGVWAFARGRADDPAGELSDYGRARLARARRALAGPGFARAVRLLAGAPADTAAGRRVTAA